MKVLHTISKKHHKALNIFDAIVNVLISIFNFSLVVQRHTDNFYLIMMHFATLLSLLDF